MKIRLLNGGLVIAVALLTSCATMSPEECATADWHQIGLQDGSQAYGSEQLAKHQKSCAKVNITPNVSQYHLGYQSGLKSYCQPQSVFSLAMDGRSNVQACPAHLQSHLHPFAQVPRQYLAAKAHLEDVWDELDRAESRLRDSKLTRSEYDYYHNRTRYLRQQSHQAQMDYNRREHELYDFKRLHNLH